MTLAAYRLTRHVGLDGVYSDGYVATRGITAGAGFATTELRLLLLRCIDSTYYVFRPLLERGWLWIYVDDVTILWIDKDGEVAAKMAARVGDHVWRWLQGANRLKVSKDKSVAVGSSGRVAKKLATSVITAKLKPVSK